MIGWISKIKTNVLRNQQHEIFAKVRHDQLCQRPFKDQLESCQSSNPCQSPLKLCHSNKKGKNL